MAFRLVTGLCALILLYAAFEWGRFAWLTHDAQTPKAAFLILNDGDNPAIVEFIDYRCNNCQATYKASADLRALHPDLTHIVRPLPYIDEESERLTRLALAAGLEGKFAEIHTAFIERNGQFTEPFLRETFSLYGLDYARALEKSKGEDVTALMIDTIDDAHITGVDSVPTFLIGRALYIVPNPIETITAPDLISVLAHEDQTR